MYPSTKSNVLLCLFVGYTAACVALFAFFITHPLLPLDGSARAGYVPAAQLIPELPISKNKRLNKIKKPVFSDINDVSEKKQQFFEFLLPMAQHINANIAIRRENLLRIKNEYQLREEVLAEKSESQIPNTKQPGMLSKKSKEYLNSLADRHQVNIKDKSIPDIIDQLLVRVDRIPPSMVLSQAANESAWGTSRFATKANNFFGQWCFRKGCGMVPKQRGEDQNHEVAKFKSVYHSVESYFKNINSHNAYRGLRQHRATLRKENKVITGAEMIQHLSRYSERGNEYVLELRQMIRTNDLAKLDRLTPSDINTDSLSDTLPETGTDTPTKTSTDTPAENE